ncbi:hypothetical protein CSHISOI_10229 [Colletotrichum shisoi]|uniref:Uncharacterized protein n=1 Tax=Colletotrichum shisoi TaxID=2078593 RepID=A0A5Q4BER2_9PEZI|nr:hypothetical protein CSHISOI_10229 [Colletotrichum shisoi]
MTRASCAVARWMLSNGTILPRFRRVIWDRQQAAGRSVRVDARGGAHPTANCSGGRGSVWGGLPSERGVCCPAVSAGCRVRWESRDDLQARRCRRR